MRGGDRGRGRVGGDRTGQLWGIPSRVMGRRISTCSAADGGTRALANALRPASETHPCACKLAVGHRRVARDVRRHGSRRPKPVTRVSTWRRAGWADTRKRGAVHGGEDAAPAGYAVVPANQQRAWLRRARRVRLLWGCKVHWGVGAITSSPPLPYPESCNGGVYLATFPPAVPPREGWSPSTRGSRCRRPRP